jgi:hypothetical protein
VFSEAGPLPCFQSVLTMSTQHLPDGSELLLRMVYSSREKQGVTVRPSFFVTTSVNINISSGSCHCVMYISGGNCHAFICYFCTSPLVISRHWDIYVHFQFSAFNTRTSLDEHLFVRTHVAAYFISLLLCDLLQSMVALL